MTEQLENIICKNHINRPKQIHLKKEGWGDCSVCIPDKVNNPYCKGYVPVRLYSVEVKYEDVQSKG